MKEKKPAKPKQEKKTIKQENAPPKVETKPAKPNTKAKKNSKVKPIVESQPTLQEIEDIKEDILEHGLLNPYALILYDYLCKSSYETNVQLVLSMRETLMKIPKINQLILNELKEA